jgi:hypothetical protein
MSSLFASSMQDQVHPTTRFRLKSFRSMHQLSFSLQHKYYSYLPIRPNLQELHCKHKDYC